MPDITLKQFHNDTVTILFNTGLLGFVCILMTYITTLRGAIRTFRLDLQAKSATIELIAVLYVVFVTGLMHSSIGWDAWCMMFVFVAVVVTVGNLSHSRVVKSSERPTG